MNETIQYYEQNSEAFIQMTLQADLSAVRARFTRYLKQGDHILDVGCGSGRDALAFKQAGYEVVAMDASPILCEKASKLLGQEVRCMAFEAIEAREVFEGIWACASLLHVPSQQIQQTLERLDQALKPGGILYMSFKYGDFEGVRNGRYFTDYTEERVQDLISSYRHLKLKEIWRTEDTKVVKQDRWLNVILAKQ